MNKCFSFLNWLRDPFGNKRLAKKHTDIRRHMVETKTRTEITTEMLRNYPIGHTLRRKRKSPISQHVVKGAGS